MDGKPVYTGAIDEQGNIVGKMPQYIYSGEAFTPVTDIGWAFCRNPYITSIPEIPSTVTNIGCLAFSGCTGIKSITIPAHIVGIDSQAFDGCTGITSINVENGNTVYDSRDNCNAVIETSTNKMKLACKTTTIPTSVTSIENYTFYGCKGLTSINIPTSVTSIGKGAFQYCTGLTSINIPTSVTSIGENAFRDCTGLTSINIPIKVTDMGGSVFNGWKSSQTINCQAPSKPSGWNSNWKYGCEATINWNVNM